MSNFIFAITGASGAVYGLQALKILLTETDAMIHLIVSPWAKTVIQEETGRSINNHLTEFLSVASFEESKRLIMYEHTDMTAPIASGSFSTTGMLIAPCSMGTLCSIGSGLSQNLIERSAAVSLKERRPLVLLAREAPLTSIHLEQMLKISQAGGIIYPPVPAFYIKPQNIEEIIDNTIRKVLSLFPLDIVQKKIWK